MSCNISIPIQRIIDDVVEALSGRYISTDNPFLNEAVLTDTTFRGEITMDTNARNAICRIVQNCDITAAELGWLPAPISSGQVAISTVDGSDNKATWEDLNTVLTEYGVAKTSNTKKTYLTYTQMQLGIADLIVGDVVDVVGDSDPDKNGTYLYNGTSFEPAPYDPLALAKTYADEMPIDATRVQYLYGVGSRTRNQADKNLEIVSIEDFYRGEPTYSPALQRAVAPGRALYFPDSDYKFKEMVTVDQPDFVMYGNGRLLWDTDGTAGSTCIHVTADGFKCIGLRHQCTTDRRAFYRVNNENTDIHNFLFDRCDFKGGFYSVRGGLLPSQNPNTTKIHGMVVRGCTSDAPTDVPAGHYIMTNSVGTKYLGNICTGGSNTSVYGINFSSDFVIIGNTEKGVTAYLNNGAEASIQIEDSDLANGIVANNICSHDIWISGANEVQVHDNKCAVLRVSVGNPSGHSVYNTVFSNNKCTAISLAKFGSYTITDTYSAVFKDNIVDPQYAVNLGRDVPSRAISIQGSGYGRYIKLENTEVISAATSYQTSIIRGADLNLVLEHNDFGLGADIQSSTGGRIYERAVANPIFPEYQKNPKAHIGLGFVADKTISTANTWVKIDNYSIARDINGNVQNTTGEIKLSPGVYEIEVGIYVSVQTAGNNLGLRIVNETGVEQSRLIYTSSTVTTATYHQAKATLRITGDLAAIYLELFSQQPVVINGSAIQTTIAIIKDK